MDSRIFAKLAVSLLILLAVTVSCSKKFHAFDESQMSFPLFALNLLPGQASPEVADVAGGGGIPKILSMLSLLLCWVLRVLQN